MVRIYLTLILISSVFCVTAQSPPRIISVEAAKAMRGVPFVPLDQQLSDIPPLPSTPFPATTTPLGSVTNSAVTAVKIGGSWNLYDISFHGAPSITAIPGAGTNGGTIAVAYLDDHHCSSRDSSGIRYSISSDGGQSWDIGTVTVPPPFTGCWGIGPLNPQSLGRVSYPNAALFAPEPLTNPDSLSLTVVGTLLGSQSADPNGYFTSLAKNTLGQYSLTQEAYTSDFGKPFYPQSLTYQAINNCSDHTFWFLAPTYNKDKEEYPFFLFKGTYNSSSEQVEWHVSEEFNLPYITTTPWRGPRFGSLHIAFSPDGQIGWIALVGDIEGGQDSTFNPIFIKSNDFGNSWGTPVELNFSSFSSLTDSLLAAAVVQDTNGQLIPVSTGKATSYPDCDLIVDSLGNPHLVSTISSASTIFDPIADYLLYPELFLKLYDITLDSLGDWNMLEIADLQAFWGELPSIFLPIYNFQNTPFLSRTKSGGKIFYHWVDTDTSHLNWFPGNAYPNLLGRALDLKLQRMTPTVPWTKGDLTFGDKVYAYQTPEIVLQTGSEYTVPVIAPTLFTLEPDAPVELWHFQDITYDQADFTDTTNFFYNCKENPQAHSLLLTPASCGGGVNGQAAIQFQGGVAPYAVQWDTAAGSATTNSVSQLGIGIYHVVITDAKGCEVELTAVIDEIGSPQLHIAPATVQAVSCHGLTDGTATVSVTGGMAPYTISWDNGETGLTASALSGGSHVVQVTDQNGCSNVAEVTIFEPSPITITQTLSEPKCGGDSTGSISLQVEGGQGGFSYLWNNRSIFPHLLGISAGTYSCQVTDKAGCSVMKQVVLTEPLPLTVSVSFTAAGLSDCSQDDGTMTAVAAGGRPPYTYRWPGAGAGSFVFGLTGGTYTVRVTDHNGCSTVLNGIENPNPLNTTRARLNVRPPTTCPDTGNFSAEVIISQGKAPFTYSWSTGQTTRTIQGIGQSDLVCKITDADGCLSTYAHASEVSPKPIIHKFSLPNTHALYPFNGAGQVVYLGVEGPVQFDWDDGGKGDIRTDLSPGVHTVTVTDACQRTYQVPITIADRSGNQCGPSPRILQTPACDGLATGSLSVSMKRGSGAFSYLWDTGDTTASITSLGAGSYSCIITDLVSGWKDTISASVSASPPISFTISSTPDNGTFNGTATINASGGTLPLSYRWSSLPTQTTATATNLQADLYKVFITDSLGCESLGVVFVGANVSNDPLIFRDIHLTVSPNPTQELLFLQLEVPETDQPSWSLWNIQGQELRQGQFALGKKWAKTLSVSELPEGLYLLQVKSATGSAVRKVEIVR